MAARDRTTAVSTLAHAVSLVPLGVRAMRAPVTPGLDGNPVPRARAVSHAVMSVLLGLVAWMLVALIGLMIARGALYGFVDDGPYDDAWGGPTRGGAWLVHFLISLPITAVAVAALVGIGRLHLRLTRHLHGERVGWWVLPLAAVVCALAVLFFVSWLGQV